MNLLNFPEVPEANQSEYSWGLGEVQVPFSYPPSKILSHSIPKKAAEGFAHVPWCSVE